MLTIREGLGIPEGELQWSAIRAQGAGGQNVNKVSSAVQLRFDAASSAALSATDRDRLLAFPDRRIGRDGIITIKAQRFRRQEQNLADARERLAALLRRALAREKRRVPTRPGRAAREKRLDDKAHRSRLKAGRGRVED